MHKKSCGSASADGRVCIPHISDFQRCWRDIIIAVDVTSLADCVLSATSPSAARPARALSLWLLALGKKEF